MKTSKTPISLCDLFDRWLCRTLWGSFRAQWSKLWVRKDEFHPSLESDAEYAVNLSPEKCEAYWQDLIRRRQIAHKRDLQESDK